MVCLIPRWSLGEDVSFRNVETKIMIRNSSASLSFKLETTESTGKRELIGSGRGAMPQLGWETWKVWWRGKPSRAGTSLCQVAMPLLFFHNRHLCLSLLLTSLLKLCR